MDTRLILTVHKELHGKVVDRLLVVASTGEASLQGAGERSAAASG
jgi:hypothetical protein